MLHSTRARSNRRASAHSAHRARQRHGVYAYCSGHVTDSQVQWNLEARKYTGGPWPWAAHARPPPTLTPHPSPLTPHPSGAPRASRPRRPPVAMTTTPCASAAVTATDWRARGWGTHARGAKGDARARTSGRRRARGAHREARRAPVNPELVREALTVGVTFLDLTPDDARVITVYPTDERTVQARRAGGRWLFLNR